MDARTSNSLADGRRRRRIVCDSDDLLAEFEQIAPPRSRPFGLVPTAIAATDVDHRVLAKLISGRIWKHGVLFLLVALAASFAVWVESGQQSQVIPAVRNGSRISAGLAGVFLLLAGQLSLFVGWIRSESSVDFRGRYRWWKWLAVMLFGIGLLWIANLQDTLPEIAQAIMEPVLGNVSAARRTIVVVPFSAVVILVLSRVIPDMGRHRTGQVLFVAGILLAALRTMVVYSTAGDSVSDYVLNGILLSSTALLFGSLMLHSRFVFYICNDPPVTSQGARTSSATKIKQVPEDAESEDVLSLPMPESREVTEGNGSHSSASESREASETSPQRRKRRARRAA